MVTAGVYLLMRTSPLIEYSSTVLILCLWLGSITTVFSSLIGLFQQDIKKVIAYSTMSQLAQEFFKFRHQTIYEKILINTMYNIYTTIIFICCAGTKLYIYNTNIFRFFFLLLVFLVFKKKMKEMKNMCLSCLLICPTSIIEHGNKINPTLSSKNIKQDYNLKSLWCRAFNNYKQIKISPYYVTGFADAESCFLINILAKSDIKIGYLVSLAFKIKLHAKDIILLERVRNYLDKKGAIYARKDGYVDYVVTSKKDLEIIVNHFDNYFLITQKFSDYKLFRQVYELIICKQHLTIEGLKKALSIKSALNNGLSDSLKTVFPNIIPENRPKVINQKIPDPHWISGFVDGEGCFFVTLINKSKGAGLIFKVTQHIRDAELLKSFVGYLGCGRYYTCSPRAGDYIVTKFDDIKTNIIPFFNKYPVLGNKASDFCKFKQVAVLIENKTHLTLQGLTKIKLLKSGMNKVTVKSELSHSSKQLPVNSLNKKIKSGKFYTIVNKLSTKGVGKRYYSTIINKNDCNDSLFNEWLSGLIDGHGEFILSKKGYASFKIIISTSDKTVLYAIKHKYGGSIKNIAGSNSWRYKLHSKKGLIKLINSVNGHIRNPTRILKLYKICLLYNIELNEPKPLTYNNAWFSGFIDADGSIYLNEQSGQLSISITQKNKYLLDPLISLYSGRVQPIQSKEAFQYSIYKKKEVLDLVDNYLSKYPLKSGKIHKLSLIKKFYLCKDYMHLDVHQLDKHNEWIKFKKEWDKL